MSKTNIQNFFTGQTIFITGGTGFLGKLIIEKLLRTCYDLEKIYILVRVKKGVTEEDRFKSIFNCDCFVPLKEKYPDFEKKCILVQGDCVKPNLGLSDQDVQILINEVTTIFHVAATVRFDQHLKTATYINVRATQDLLKIGKEAKNLRAFVHVSTAYTHSPRFNIKEQFYESPMTSEQLIQLVDILDDKTIEDITPTILREWPNTYAFTKCVAEDTLQKYGSNLPLTMVRPAIICSTYREPIPGYIDNVYGINGVFTAWHVGLLRCAPIDPNIFAEIVVADLVVNNIIAAAWDIGKDGRSQPETVPIYNHVSQNAKPLTYRDIHQLAKRHNFKIPSNKMIWYPILWLTGSAWVFWILALFMHYLPSFIIDVGLWTIGKKPFFIDAYKKLHKFVQVISYFGTNHFTFCDKNVVSLYDSCSKEDQELFNFNLAKVDAEEFMVGFIGGARKHLINDPDSTIPAAKLRWKIFKVLNLALCALIFFGLYKILRFFITCFL